MEQPDLKISLNLNFNKKLLMMNLINELNMIIFKIEAYSNKQSIFRIRQYQDTIKFLSQFPHQKIESYNQIINYYDLHNKKKTKILEKIEEFCNTGKIEEAVKGRNDPIVIAIKNFSKIYGVGPKKSIELYNKYNVNTIEQLYQLQSLNEGILNQKQKIGLIYYEELEKKIPRLEIDAYFTEISNICSEISENIKFSINGSYRRGLPFSGDIDLLITSSSENTELLRKKIIKNLIAKNIIIETLADGKKKFMGIVRLEKMGFKIARHIDIMDTNYTNYPFAQLYFTGSGPFNTIMRAQALKLGYSLNEYCLSDKQTKIEINSNTIYKKIKKNTFESEKDIFNFLDMDYKLPTERNINQN